MFHAKKVTFKDLLGTYANSQIRVPDYQRGYSWENREVEDFLNDLTNFIEVELIKVPDKLYFMGPIVVMPGEPSDSYIYAVDGQQRIATIIITLAVLRDLSEEFFQDKDNSLADEIYNIYIRSEGLGGNARWSLRLGDLDQSFFEKFIQHRLPRQNIVPRNKSNGLIMRAKNQIEQFFRSKYVSVDDPYSYFKGFFKCLTRRIILIAIEVKTDRDAMNVFERINVRGKPLSESDLIRHRIMSDAKKTDRPNIRRQWSKIENILGNEETKIDTFLKHMWLSRGGSGESIKLYDAISVYLQETNKSPLEFAKDCVKDCEIYKNLLKINSNKLLQESRDTVRATHATLGAKQTLPLFLAAYRKFGRTENFSKLAFAIESLIVRYKYFAALPMSELIESLSRIINVINADNTRNDALNEAINLLKIVDPDEHQILSGVQGQMKLNKLPALYILRQLETLNNYEDVSILDTTKLEYIFPKDASQNYWGQAADRLKPYLFHIGNLTLLAKNDYCKNIDRGFSYKKNNIYAESCLELTKKINDYRNWGIQPIIRRASFLATLSNKRWKVG